MKKPKISFKMPKVKVYGIDIVKNALFFMLFIVLTLLAIAFLISPAVHSFKKAKNDYYQSKYNLEQTTALYKEKFKELNKIKNANSKLLNAFKRDFDKKNFKMYVSKYMDVKKIKEVNSTVYKNHFIKTTYIMDAAVKSPKAFYDLIDSLKKYKAVLRVYFPIDFVKNSENITLKLKLEHYRLKNSKKSGGEN